MSEIYIRVDNSTRIITFVHKRPFDPIHGLNTTRDELLKTGFFVDEYPEPNSMVGKRAIAYYDHEKKKVYYEYEPTPFVTIDRLNLLENSINDIALNRNQVASPRAMYRSASTIQEEHSMNGLAKYLASQIYHTKLDKEQVYATYPELSEDIEKYLAEWETIPVITEDE